MNYSFKIILAAAGSIFLVLLTQLVTMKMSAWDIDVGYPDRQSGEQIPEQALRQIASSVTVKVMSQQSRGSGILIRKEGQVYTVLTNKHILEQAPENSYQIQTPDGQIYRADLVKTVNLEGYDLSLLSFYSSRTYSLAMPGSGLHLAVGDQVFAGGFPFNHPHSGVRGFTLTTGQISMFSENDFDGGYSIGYTNPIEKGMSGGPLLNRQGQVIGINGIDASPAWGNSYTFADGSIASKALKLKMSQLSWAIPVQTFLQMYPQFSPKAVQSPPVPSQFPAPEIDDPPPEKPSRWVKS